MDNTLVQKIADAVEKLAWEIPAPNQWTPRLIEITQAARSAALAQSIEVVAHGCHCDLEPHMEPDGCVIDEGRRQDCLYARSTVNPIASKEECKYWQPVKMLTTHSPNRVAELEAQLTESRERVARAYGLLWHVNAGIDAPWGTPSLTPERAAMESRKVLRDMLTSEQRGDGINAARDLMKALADDQEKNDE